MNIATTESIPANDVTGLVHEAKAGSDSAFHELVRRHQNLVCSYAYALTGSIGQSEEVAQEVFIAAWRQLPKLKAADRFRPWLLSITHNLGLRAKKRVRRQIAEPLRAEVASLEASPLESAIHREEERLLWRALAAIPEAYRIPLVLFYREGQSIERIARELDLGLTNVKMRLMRGRRMLEEQALLIAETVLSRTQPGKRFTTAVIAALAGIGGGEPASASGPSPAGGAVPRIPIGKSLLRWGGLALVVPLLGFGLHRLATTSTLSSPAATPANRQIASALSLTPWAAQARPSGAHPRAMTAGVSGLVADPADHSVVLSYDFEDGIEPGWLPNGQLSASPPCPPRPGNKFCLVASVAVYGESQLRVHAMAGVGDRNFLFHVSRTQVVSFDYWLGSPDANLVVQIGAPDHHPPTVYLFPRNLVRREWGHAELPIAEARAWPESAPKVQEGESITTIELATSGDKNPKEPLYLDNLKVVDLSLRGETAEGTGREQ